MPDYLSGSCDKASDHEQQGEHEDLHPVSRQLSILLAVDVHVVEVGRILRTDGDHGGVCHNSGHPICKAGPNSLEASIFDQLIALFVDQIRAPQLLSVAVQMAGTT